VSNRKVSTDALETLGQLIDDTQKRDAIHLAVEPTIAGERLFPGQSVGIVDGKATARAEPLGIVDPFLTKPVFPDQRFWLVLFPRMVTSLRHVWSHPAFPDEGATGTTGYATSLEWLENFASGPGLSLHEIVKAAVEYLDCGTYLIEGGRWEGMGVPNEFWTHFEIVTGRKVREDERGSFFSCSC
jgi:hypothetical protein